MKTNWITAIISSVFLFSAIFLVNNALAKQTMPERLIKARIDYFEKNINKGDKLYIEQTLRKSFLSLSKLNETTSLSWQFLPNPDELKSKMIDTLDKFRNKVSQRAFDVQSVVENRFNDLMVFYPGKTKLSFLSNAIDINTKLLSLKTISEIASSQNELKSCRLFLENLGKFSSRDIKLSPQQLLKRASDDFNRGANNLMHVDKIDELKKFLADLQNIFQTAYKQANTYFINKSKADTAYYKIASNLSELSLAQLKLNIEACQSSISGLNKINLPPEPKMPDFEISSLDIKAPRNANGLEKKQNQVLIGDKITIIASVKNLGIFPADPVDAEIKNNEINLKLNKTLPLLNAGETAKIEWDYELIEPNNFFEVTVNPDEKTWEDDSPWEIIAAQWENRKRIVYNIRPAEDLIVEFTDLPTAIYKDKATYIKVNVRNEGNATAPQPKVLLLENDKLIAKRQINDVRRKQPCTVVFEWIPKDVGSYRLECIISPGARRKDFNDDNNNVVVDTNVVEDE